MGTIIGEAKQLSPLDKLQQQTYELLQHNEAEEERILAELRDVRENLDRLRAAMNGFTINQPATVLCGSRANSPR